MSANAKVSDVYQDRITCFIDILGFSRDVVAIDTNPALFLSVDAVLRHVSRCKLSIDQARAQRGTSYDARMSCFSDCLVVSYRCEPGATLRALWDAAFLGHVIIRPGYLRRGAMTVGKLYHDDVVVYGSALVEAAKLEENVVSTPRIAITDRCMELIRADLSREGASDLLEDFVRDDGSGPFVHVLGREWSFLEKERQQEQAGEIHGEGVAEMFREVRTALPLRYAHAPHERAKQKLEWMRDYVNRSVDEHGLPEDLKISLPASDPSQ
ncbi:MAG: hypothetical protein ACREVV_14000 [Steroidobacteraceae bacterium]